MIHTTDAKNRREFYDRKDAAWAALSLARQITGCPFVTRDVRDCGTWLAGVEVAATGDVWVAEKEK